MSLIQIWKENPDQLSDKRVDQIIGFAGDGKLRDNGTAPSEFRAFLTRVPVDMLARYADECLKKTFTDSGLALQDIVNLIPFDMISAISPVLPRSIHFTRLKTAGRNSLEIECKTTNLAEVTTYKNGLEGLLKIESAEVRNLQSAGGEGSFILMVNFKADAFEVSRNQLQNDGAVTVTEGELLEAVKGGRNES